MKELITDIFKYGWKPIGGTVLGIIILVFVIRKIIDARRRHLRALERANAPGPQPIAELDLELDKRDKSRPKDSREIDLPKRRKKPNKEAAKEKKEQLSNELDDLLESGSARKKPKETASSKPKAKKAPTSTAAKEGKSSPSKKKSTTTKPKRKTVTKEELKKSLKEELKAELRAELKAELKAEIEADEAPKPRPKRKKPPTQHGELEPAYTIDPAAADHIRPNRRRSIAQSEQEVAAESREVTPTSSPDTAPIAASTSERKPEPEEAVEPVAAPEAIPEPAAPAPVEPAEEVAPSQPDHTAPLKPRPISPAAPAPAAPASAPPAPAPVAPSPAPVTSSPAPAPTSPAPVSPAPVRPQQPAPVAPSPVAASAPPAQASTSTPKSFETPEPVAPKGLLGRFFKPKDPREHIGERLAIKRGKLKGRYGTIVSVEGNVVTISDKSGKTTTVDAGDF